MESIVQFSNLVDFSLLWRTKESGVYELKAVPGYMSN
jgi:hypothetical protein